MGIAYRTDKRLGLTTVVWDGVVTADDWRTHLAELLDDPEWPPGNRSLTDLRSADVSTITESDRAGIVALYEPRLDDLRGMKSAAVAGDNFEASTDFESHKEPAGLRLIIFNDLVNACTWLGIDHAAAQAGVNALRDELRALK